MMENRKSMSVRFQFCVALILLVVKVPDSAAWGPQGHRVIGFIADGHLKPEVKELIAEKFNINSLADVATWADRTRKKRKEESSWHYTNIEEGQWTYDAERDCPDRACVTEKIHEFSSILRSTPLRERKDALKFLVHFVGDVHQPLHLGNLKDRGRGTLRFLYKGKDVFILGNGPSVNSEDLNLLKDKIRKENATGIFGKISDPGDYLFLDEGDIISIKEISLCNK